ncbi:pyridoxal phosphate-dependent aminotransferase [Pseudoflavonifractor phocaeensis]|uniref:pyridoxal phosphate-dependent aminotransferase n=1 Tax=Pseudoflavonifractor phocaeensis TaxID=1870988 RepID=UPI00210B9BDE|nr:pyridoxal phosphate-dependent aminotransferase [Pseudoflavonifractor phocaeensis]MCQ4864214.1 pyridoxal phosphate-dependent aminotransferase [Pseudoflavonifractor phocaeensis]
MKELSRIASAIQPSATMAIDSLFKQMKAEGVDVIGFGAGEPDFNTPDEIKAAGAAAIEQNFTRYTPAAGTVELRQAVCDRMKADCGLIYKPSQIVAASGAKHAVYLALRALVNPGDEVILPAPYWVSYIELIQMMGGVPVVVTATEEEHFKLTAEMLAAAITPKTKALILNNPSNPTGMMYGREELQAIAGLCVKNEIYVVDDEIYYGLVYDGREFVSLASLGEEIQDLTVLVNGVSKSYAMTGWRIGYACANDRIAKIMANYVSHSTGSPCAISQKASVEALTGSQAKIETMRQAFEARRNAMVEGMNAIPGVSCLKPEGAFYVMMNLKDILGRTLHGVKIGSAEDFAALFLKKGLVAVVPGTSFGAPGFVRWSYACSMDNIKEGLARLAKFLTE